MDVMSGRMGADNSNPAFLVDGIGLDGALWSEPSSELFSSDACSGQPRRETVVAAAGTSSETLQVSHFSSSGELERALSILEATRPADALSIELGWRASRSVPAEGRTVRFYFVVRDLRGGTGWTRRALCLLP
jgi:hypothetical protein